MKNTLLVAATLLSLGAGAAFANEAPVNAQAVQATQASAANPAQPAASQHLLFSTQNRHETWVYPQFGYAGLGGGER